MQPQFITPTGRYIDITNQRFGRLVALGPIERDGRGGIKWLLQCDCGNTVTVVAYSLRSGNTQSCGCLKRDIAPVINRTHGMKKHPLYRVWCGMNKRCSNPNDSKYAYYGGRGINVCDEWRTSFESFHTYVSALSNYRMDGYTLDRIDGNRNYEPGNIQWSTRKSQTRNRRNTVSLTLGDETRTLAEWAEKLNQPYDTLKHRVLRGWSDERVLLTPVPR